MTPCPRWTRLSFATSLKTVKMGSSGTCCPSSGMGAERVVEICAGDGIECCSANLIVNHGWQALSVRR